jgi:hypothetical protein
MGQRLQLRVNKLLDASTDHAELLAVMDRSADGREACPYSTAVVVPTADPNAIQLLATLKREQLRDEERWKKAGASCCHVLSLIYAYSRNYMLEKALRTCTSKLLMDTDSLLIRMHDYRLMREMYPELFESADFGHFTSDMAELYSSKGLRYMPGVSTQRISAVRPKMYMIEDIDVATKQATVLKIRAKGVTANDIVLTIDTPEDILSWAGLLKEWHTNEVGQRTQRLTPTRMGKEITTGPEATTMMTRLQANPQWNGLSANTFRLMITQLESAEWCKPDAFLISRRIQRHSPDEKDTRWNIYEEMVLRRLLIKPINKDESCV